MCQTYVLDGPRWRGPSVFGVHVEFFHLYCRGGVRSGHSLSFGGGESNVVVDGDWIVVWLCRNFLLGGWCWCGCWCGRSRTRRGALGGFFLLQTMPTDRERARDAGVRRADRFQSAVPVMNGRQDRPPCIHWTRWDSVLEVDFVGVSCSPRDRPWLATERDRASICCFIAFVLRVPHTFGIGVSSSSQNIFKHAILGWVFDDFLDIRTTMTHAYHLIQNHPWLVGQPGWCCALLT